MSQTTESVIHDLGYQRYPGVRLGRGYAIRSLYLHSLRSAFGLGRGLKAKIFPWSVISVIAVVAVVLTALLAVAGERPLTYPHFSDQLSMLTVLLAASAASEMVTRDLSSGALALYFARPLRRSDYALAKLLAIVTALLLVLILPQLLIFAGLAFSTNDGMTAILAELGRLGSGMIQALFHATVIGSIAVLAASLCRRRVFASIAVVAVFLVTTPVAEILRTARGTLGGLSGLVSPLVTVGRAGNWLFDTTGSSQAYGPWYLLGVIGFAAGASAALVMRYRRVR